MTYSINLRPILSFLVFVLIAFLLINLVSYNSRVMMSAPLPGAVPNSGYDTIIASTQPAPFVQYK